MLELERLFAENKRLKAELLLMYLRAENAVLREAAELTIGT